jgi:hypothetical protein
MQNGRVIASGPAREIAASDALRTAFMGEHRAPTGSEQVRRGS